MGYKLIALDIDGTIRSDEYPISPRTIKVMNDVRQAGAVVTVATGRTFTSAVRMSAELDIRSPIATFQGAHVADPISSEVFWQRSLTQDMTLLAMDALSSCGMEIMGQSGTEVFVLRKTPWIEGYGQRNNVDVRVLRDVQELAGMNPMRLVVVGAETRIRDLEGSLQSQFSASELHVTRSLPHFCEILHPEGGKDKALEWLCGYLDIKQDQTIAFGNGYNDVHMLRWAGMGVAIGGAVPEVLDVADSVAPPIEDDGAAQLLEGLLEKGLIG